MLATGPDGFGDPGLVRGSDGVCGVQNQHAADSRSDDMGTTLGHAD